MLVTARSNVWLPPCLYGMVEGPFTAEQARRIQAWQANPNVHPLTCPEHSDQALIIARTPNAGRRLARYFLICAEWGCDYVQTTVPGIMLGPLP